MAEETILDIILEKTFNTEKAINKHSIQKHLNEQFKIIAKRERKAREATIIISHSADLDSKTIVERVEAIWLKGANGPPVSFWSAKDATFAEFDSRQNKLAFLEVLTAENGPNLNLIQNIKSPNEDGEHYKRLDVKFEITSVPTRVKLEPVKEAIEAVIGLSSNVNNFKESKERNGLRQIYFRANQHACDDIVWKAGGVVNVKSHETRTRIYPRILARPFICKDCNSIGFHECKGKVCSKCGNQSHTSENCKAKTKSCVNCKTKGHRAKEQNCPKYLQAVINEIRKMNVPLNFYEDKAARFIFIKNLSF